MRLLVLILSLLISNHALAQDPALDGLRQTGKAFSSVARKAGPSVVFIQTEGRVEQEVQAGAWPFQDEVFRRFFGEDFPGLQRRGPSKPRRTAGQGSGFVFAGRGELSYILTNNHVVENAARIRVKFQDGREFEARVKGTDPKSDVAVLEVAERGLPALKWADSTRLEVGEWVVALGNPFGLSHTLTTGVVSAKGRTSLGINDYEDFIQTDAAINPGNSGGPLLNLDGEVVGMNTAIFSKSGGYMGVGFAIPSNLARSMAEQILSNGKVVRGYIGLHVQPLTPEIVEALGLKDNRGVLVNQVNENSPAERAGLKPGDVLVSLDGAPLSDGGQYRTRAALAQPGVSVTLGVLRDGQRLELPVRVGRLNEEAVQSAEAARSVGLTVRAPSADEARRLKDVKAVVVTAVAPRSLGERAGLHPGAVILEVNRKPVGSPGEFAAALGEGGGSLTIKVFQDGQIRQITLRWK
jgi:serine protease Do